MKASNNNWTTHALGDLCDICRGSSPRPIADQRYFVDGTIPWIKIADATKSGKYLYDTKEHVNEFGASFSRYLPKGSLIIAASGTLGYPQMLGVKGCAHDGWLIPSNFRGIDSHFLYYYFLWKKEFFYSSAYGAAIQNINTMILKEMEVTIPPLPTQRKIASILSAYDDLLENNTRRIAILEEMAQAIYREWFVTRDELIKAVSVELGYRRLGNRIEEALKGHLRAAIRRKIIAAEGELVCLHTPAMESYDRDELIDTFRSVMRKGQVYEREEVMRALANHLGFRRLTETVKEPIKSAINGAIRRGLLGYDGDCIWRED